MKYIYRYDGQSPTGMVTVEVDDDYTLKAGEATELPAGFTPYKLVDGKLTASTKEESDAFYQKQNGNSMATAPQITPTQQMMAVFTKQMSTLSGQVTALEQTVAVQNKQIAELKGGK
ncbi:hypothetical protein [Ligilactobacillus sp. LYQ60]|uniref:hypothetical protein n=1 Tax=Ligilactobacillus sp. LYQ60 TaxID=3378799 RepID=UPI00385489EC